MHYSILITHKLLFHLHSSVTVLRGFAAMFSTAGLLEGPLGLFLVNRLNVWDSTFFHLFSHLPSNFLRINRKPLNEKCEF